MLVREICTTDVNTATRATSVVDVARSMRELHTGDVVIVDDEAAPHPIAIVTDRDLVVAVLAQAAERAAELRVADILVGRELISVRDDADVVDALEAMWHAAVRRAPVVDFAGTLRGILSIDDVIVALTDQGNAVARLIRAQPGRERRERS